MKNSIHSRFSEIEVSAIAWASLGGSWIRLQSRQETEEGLYPHDRAGSLAKHLSAESACGQTEHLFSPVLRSTPTPEALVGRPSDVLDLWSPNFVPHSLRPEIASQKRLAMTERDTPVLNLNIRTPSAISTRFCSYLYTFFSKTN